MPDKLTIATLLPSATEIVGGLLEDRSRLLGITHECDYPDWVTGKDILIRPFTPMDGLSQAEIDTLIVERAASGESAYLVDETKLEQLGPDVVVTQAVCDVCAAGESEVDRALDSLTIRPTLVSLTGKTIAGVMGDIEAVGKAIGEADKARDWVGHLKDRIATVQHRAESISTQPSVVMLEWFDPLYIGGHWVPEMIEAAGGRCPLGRRGEPSFVIDYELLQKTDPDIILLAGCGYDVFENLDLAVPLIRREGWHNLSAVQKGRVYAVDANSLTCRPGPRIADGVELFYELFHGDPTGVDEKIAMPFTGP